ncbi:MAG: heavy metal translocating P-type ATPase [Acidobacteria bacterium]|nr:heavy metal translocating P-type ATPase [Acidobacteriota bacterium]
MSAPAAGEPRPTSCSLCGLPAGRGPISRPVAGQDRVFCCLGCMNVYTILAESGVTAQGVDFRDTELYKESLRLGLISSGQAARKFEIPEGAETRDAVFQISGMWCSACGWVIEHALASEPGVVSAEVMFTSDLLKVRYCPLYVPPGRIPSRVESLGYKAAEYAAQTERDNSERRSLLLRLGVAFFLWMNVMTVSLVVYASYWESISDSARAIVPWVLMGLATPAVLYSAWPILRGAWFGLRTFTLRMESLLALGILAAYGYSVAQAVLGGQHYYFDTACAIIMLVLLGKVLERGAKERTAQSIALLYRMMPAKARLLQDGRERFISIDALEPGMTFLVKTGERIPADGVVVSGDSHVDESVLTGESALRHKLPGETVICGSLAATGVLEIRATRVGAGSTLNQIIQSVQAALNSRSRIERTVDRVSRIFVPAVTALAALTLIGWLAAGLDIADALMRAIAVLVIACPCALGIATPLAITAAVGACSRRGILVSDARVLELAGNIGNVIFDKTGTITLGEFSVVAVHPAGVDIAPLAAIEQYSEHPLGRAVVRYAESLRLATPRANDIVVLKGCGIQGRVAGSQVFAGNRRLIADQGLDLDRELEQKVQQWEAAGHTVAYFGADGQLTGAVALGDRIRPEAAPTIAGLKLRGVRTAIVSGDSARTTASVAAQTGVDEFRAEVLPAGKMDVVKQFQASGAAVAMVGDGVNDAPALAAADLGIALGSGAALAMQAAPVVLMSSDLNRVVAVFETARDAMRVVKQNLFWAFFYNVAGITLAITGILNPILAAGAMVLSSLSVIGNSLRLNARVSRR